MATTVVKLDTDGGLSEVSVPAVGATAPAAPGTAAPGSSADAARADHVHPPGASVGFVDHGGVAGTARPTGYSRVLWFGSVEPTNAQTSDVWYPTS